MLGLYYLSIMKENEPGEGMVFGNIGELQHALDTKARDAARQDQGPLPHRRRRRQGGRRKIYETTPGRLIIGELLPKNHERALRPLNKLMTKKEISKMIDAVYRHCGQKETVIFCDRIMELGFTHACQAGISFGKDDMVIPDTKAQARRRHARSSPRNTSSSTMTA